MKNFLYVYLESVPEFFKKIYGETVWSRSFVAFKWEDGASNFFLSKMWDEIIRGIFVYGILIKIVNKVIDFIFKRVYDIEVIYEGFLDIIIWVMTVAILIVDACDLIYSSSNGTNFVEEACVFIAFIDLDSFCPLSPILSFFNGSI